MSQIVEVPPPRVILSNISGSVSIACWTTVLLPQLLEQWRLKSADGLSLEFLLAWFFGDITNLLGALWGQLRPNVTLLAVWFCFTDSLLLCSYYYYKRLEAKSTSTLNNAPQSPRSEPNSVTPLLQEDTESVDSFHTDPRINQRQQWLLSTGLPAVFVIVVSILSYFISDSSEETEPNFGARSGPGILGYISAVLYLTARIPQIIQNHRRKSVEGLSMGFFALSLLGNITYTGQVVLYRTDKHWLQAYFPWLLGSLGTVFEDLVVLMQFHMYKR